MNQSIVSPLRCLVVALSIFGATVSAYGQPSGGQEVCYSIPTGKDVFSVGEVRTSILPQTTFQELNGPEWVLMDGRPLNVTTALSVHLPQTAKRLKIPDARGRFLRMANNNVCADFRTGGENQAQYNECIARHDPDGDRPLGQYQADDFGKHGHAHKHKYNDIYWSEAWGQIKRNLHGNRGDMDRDNKGYGFDRTTHSSGPPSGGHETRPRNIAVNYFIKICYCRTEICK